MISEEKWAIVVVAGPSRQHLAVGELRSTRRAAWQACLDEYGRIWRDTPEGDMAVRTGYDLFHEQRAAGKLRAVKVAVSWEAIR